MNPSEPTIRVYDDLLTASSFTLSWLPSHTFPVGDATLDERELLRSLAGLELHFQWALADARGFVKDFVIHDNRSCFMYAAEPTSAPRNRVRSFKGLFAKSGAIRRGAFIEHEVALSQGYSHLVGLVKVTEDNFDECVKWFGDGTRSFIISSQGNEVFSAEFAKMVLVECGPPLPGHSYINYLRLVLRVCTRGDCVYRMGGYGREGEADFQIFTDKAGVLEEYERLATQLHRGSLEQ